MTERGEGPAGAGPLPSVAAAGVPGPDIKPLSRGLDKAPGRRRSASADIELREGSDRFHEHRADRHGAFRSGARSLAGNSRLPGDPNVRNGKYRACLGRFWNYVSTDRFIAIYLVPEG